MTDTTKPPERILRPRRCEIQYSWQEEGYDHPIRIVSDEYILASSLPGSVEEIEELLKALRADEYKMTSSMRVRRALAAMRPRGKEEET